MSERWRRHDAFAPRKSNIIAKQAQRKRPALHAFAGVCWGSVDGAIVKGDGVAGRDVPADDLIVIAQVVDIWDFLLPIIGIQSLTVKALRTIVFAPFMRSGQKLQRRLPLYIIQRNP